MQQPLLRIDELMLATYNSCTWLRCLVLSLRCSSPHTARRRMATSRAIFRRSWQLTNRRVRSRRAWRSSRGV